MIGTVILAAGASNRFGSPKQLLVHKGQSLVRVAAKAATAARTSPVIVVLGANGAQVAAELTRLRGVRTVVNEHWATGLASSLSVGLRALMEISGCDAVLIMLADQPGVDAAALKKLIAAFDDDHRIVAAGYAGIAGVPAVFGCEHIKELMRITGDKGAGQWLRDHLDRVTTVPLPEAELDIDTTQDAEQLG
ncbi:MAG: NTP transferase domain-containing protein [Gemmatimonadaceae bacterium]